MYVHSLFIAATYFGRTWAIIRQYLLLEVRLLTNAELLFIITE
jgi:hypothetical protein